MSTDVQTATGTATGPTVRTAARRYRGPALVVAALVLAGVVVGALTATGPSGLLDPDAYSPNGARALSELLRDDGVDVRRAGTIEQVQEAQREAGDRTTVVVPFPEALVEPELEALAALDIRQVELEARQPACDLPAAQRAGEALLGGLTYRAVDGQQAAGCYASGGRATLLDLPARRAVLLGDGSLLTNAELGETGNAALALGLLADSEQVVFVLPQAGRAVPEGSQPPLSDLVPDGLKLAVVQGFVALLVLALWRTRRLGRVVEEPLPVVVRAAEAIEGRSRLYRAAGARGQAAEQLRAGTRDRVVRRLGLGPDSGREAVLGPVVQRTGRDAAVVDALLYGAAPDDDTALVRLSDDLRSLEGALTEDRSSGSTQTREVAGS